MWRVSVYHCCRRLIVYYQPNICIMKTFIAVLLVLALIVVLLWLVIGRGRATLMPPTEDDLKDSDPENDVYTMKSRLEGLCREHGTRSLKGLMRIFEFELKKNLIVYDDTDAQKFQIYDAGADKQPRWTVLLPFVKDHVGKAFHPIIQFDETLADNGWTPGHVYPSQGDYRKLYGKKVAFADLPWEVQVFILMAIDAPLVEEYELEGEQF